MLKNCVTQRELLWKMSGSDFRTRYAGTVLGMLWAFIPPLVTLLVYVLVFSVGFRSAPVADVPYVLWLFCGMAVWLFFSEVLSAVTGALFAYGHLVKKTCFPAELLPAVRAFGSLPVHLVFVGLLLITAVLSGSGVSLYWLQLGYYSLCALALGTGLGLVCCTLSPFFRDIANTVGIVLQIGFWITPIAWSVELFGPEVQSLLKLNPAHYLVQGYRDSLLYGVGFWQRPLQGLGFWAVTAALWALGLWLFRRLRPQFADFL